MLIKPSRHRRSALKENITTVMECFTIGHDFVKIRYQDYNGNVSGVMEETFSK